MNISRTNTIHSISNMFSYSGTGFTEGLNIFRQLGVPMILRRTYIVRCYVIPAVNKVWGSHQRDLLQKCQECPVNLAGDARFCSPGHTAKYGEYTFLDVDNTKVIHLELVPVSHWLNRLFADWGIFTYN